MKLATALVISLFAPSAALVMPRSKANLPPRMEPQKAAFSPEVGAQALKIISLRGGAVDFATTVAPAIGATIANAMFATGFPEIVAKRKAGALGNFNPIPCALIFGNCMGWLAYSFIKKDPFVAAANIPGLMLGIWYTLTTYRLAAPDVARSIEKVMMTLTAVHIAAGTYACFVLPDRAAMVGLYGLVNNAILLAYYGAPLSTIKTVLKDKSAATIYFPTVLVNGLNGVFWSVYALAIKDNYLLAPNAIGAALAGIQIFLCVIFSGKKA